MWFPRLQRISKPLREAQAALDEAQHAIEEVKERDNEIESLVRFFRKTGQEDHFAQKLEGIIIRPRRPVSDT